VNAPPGLAPSATAAGPALAPEELAGHKLLALVDRAAARDFADVYVLAHRLVCRRPASVLRNLAIRACTIGRKS
jgi:predicted nucleotidyltransferase component of viral defense system